MKINLQNPKSLKVGKYRIALEIGNSEKGPDGFSYPLIKESSVLDLTDLKTVKVLDAFSLFRDSKSPETDLHLVRMIQLRMAHIAGESGYGLGPMWTVVTTRGAFILMPDVVSRKALCYSQSTKTVTLGIYTPGPVQIIEI